MYRPASLETVKGLVGQTKGYVLESLNFGGSLSPSSPPIPVTMQCRYHQFSNPMPLPVSMGDVRNLNPRVHDSPRIRFYLKLYISMIIILEIHGFTGKQGTCPNVTSPLLCPSVYIVGYATKPRKYPSIGDFFSFNEK